MISPEGQVIEAMFKIQNKDGMQVPYTLNPSQRAYDEQRTKRDIIAKARQKGFSSYGVALQVVKCLGIPGTRAVLMSHEAGATQRLLDKAQYYIKYLNGPQPELGRHSRNELYFPKTESTYYIGTAGAKAFGRGDTITDLHISEYAWWETDGLKHVAGIMQAVPASGSIRIESTSNGMANDYYYMVMNAKKLGYNVFFRSWWEDDEYSFTPPERWTPEGFESYFQDMKTRFNLTEGQLFWYYCKLMEFRGNLKTMQQEYPSTLEESFQATGGAVFPEVEKSDKLEWTWGIIEGRRCEYLPQHPKREFNYVLGADPSGGTGHDEAAIAVFCLETFEQVFEFGDNTIDPVDFAHYLVLIAKRYNDAYVVCEANNHGIAVLSILRKSYMPTRLYKKEIPKSGGKIRYGLQTTEANKHMMVGACKELIDEGLIIYGRKTFLQMKAFSEDLDGKMGAPEDGLVIATCLACVGMQKYYRQRGSRYEKPKVDTKRILYIPGSGMTMKFEEIFKPRESVNRIGIFNRQLQ